MIVQFGTSRFLQAHVDLFAWQASQSGQDVPSITVVQMSGDPVRARRLPAFSDPAGFPVILRGIRHGKRIDQQVDVRSVQRGLAARRDWQELQSLFVDQASHIISNSGDGGFEVPPADRVPRSDQSCPQSFPAMIVALLHLRWLAGRPGITILPCELIARNGDALRAVVMDLVSDQGLSTAFARWLNQSCLWVNTLVDRIVSEPIEPAGAVAEPYALWAVERQPGLFMPFTHPAIVLTDNLERYERLKLHILNLSHSWLAARWGRLGCASGMTVREAMAAPLVLPALRDLLYREVVPGFAAHGMEDDARIYIETTLERFANPFLDHRLSDIAQDHALKVDKRIGGFIRWVQTVGEVVSMPELSALIAEEQEANL